MPHTLKQVADSLKKYNRPDLEDAKTPEGRQQNINALKSCFVDPIKGNKILESVSGINHLFLVGRRGTGKSTLFLRSQIGLHEGHENQLTTYLDINSIFEATKRNITSTSLESQNALSREENIIFFIVFLGNVYKEIFKPIITRYSEEFIEPVISEEKKKKLINISDELQQICNDFFSFDVNDIKSKIPKDYTYESITSWIPINLNLNIALESIEKVLLQEKFLNVHIFIDDYNELPLAIQDLVHINLMEALFKRDGNTFLFKAAKYPGMEKYGTIDIQKIDSINLDFHGLFNIYHKDFSERAKFAKENIKSLITLRANYFNIENVDALFEKPNEFIDLLFDITLGNPRYIGWLLDYSVKLVADDETISTSVLEKASHNYYEVKIQPLFERTALMQRPFNLKTETYNIIDLLKKITQHSRSIRKDVPKRYSKYKDLKNPPTSYFYVSPFYEDILEFLELNLFLNKIREAKTKDTSNVIIFSLNHGLCKQQKIDFGRPEGREYRDYQIENIFNYNSVIADHLQESIQYKCINCSKVYTKDEFDAFKHFNYNCPSCRFGDGSVKKIALSPLNDIAKAKFSTLDQFDEPTIELLFNLKDDEEPKPVSQIAAETDYSYQLLGWKNRALMNEGFTEKELKSVTGKGSRVFYKLKDKGEEFKKHPHNFMEKYLSTKNEEIIEMVKEENKFDIAFSFAGEDREIVKQLAEKCIEENISVFYDEFHKASLWGKDLYQYLHQIYSQSASYCIIFVSRHYNQKLWTKHELKSAQEKEFLENDNYILPLKLDGTTLPDGVRTTKGYIDLNHSNLDEIIKLIKIKLKEKSS